MKQQLYSYGFRRLYKMFEESCDAGFVSKFKEKFSLNDIEYRSLLAEVKSFKKREEAQKERKIEKINELQEELANPNISKRERFKKMRSLAYHKRRLDKEPTFGNLNLQQRLTRECNKRECDDGKIEKLRDDLRASRIRPFSVIGEANQKGNRFFDFSQINDGIVTYKPQKGVKIEIQVKVPKNYSVDLIRMSDLMYTKEIPVQISLSTQYLYVTYDEERLNGYDVDDVSRRQDVKYIKSQHHPQEIEKSLIKQVYKEYYDKQRDHKSEGKVLNRCVAIDMNPTNIGWSVLDKTTDGIQVIACGDYNLSLLCRKNGKSSNHKTTVHLNNKRKYEISIIAKELFKTCKHFRCSSFVIEDLEFKDKQHNRETNRLTKNIWNRKLLVDIINRRCNESGVELIKVNSCYTSFIGNVQHKYIDATNASIEIGRRGLWKYTKGGFFPQVRIEDISTLEAKFGDVVCCSTDSDWVTIHKSLKNIFGNEEFSCRLRTGIEEVATPWKSFSVNSYKSRINSIIFTNL